MQTAVAAQVVGAICFVAVAVHISARRTTGREVPEAAIAANENG